QSVAKHPRDYSKNGDVGHAWIYVQGYMDGELVALEGGHSGEVDPKQVTYLDGVVNGALYGSVDPSKPTWEQKNFGSNPIAYLWEERTDGFFQIGSGGHWPTLAARVDLTDEEFRDVVDWLQDGYDFERYSFMDHHCCHFIIEAAQRVGLRLDASQRMVFDQDLRVGGVELRLWEDAYYSEAILASPDALERCLEQEIELGELEDAMDWYVSKHRKEKESPTVWLKALPQRVARWWALR
ncbi:MAG: hypothetical protein KDK78_11380, partial [Chlamydiia bacterium]|nr:hypothetical protein [Chlamydiia bacterium]